jgi:hydroxymethylpyrimidine pyrophosphatase-like HAD family hydrolase
MYCRVLACDLDGTTGSDGHIGSELAAVVAAARAEGVATMLVTGRVLEELQMAGGNVDVFDAVVAENGALLWLPTGGRMLQLGPPPPERLLGGLRARGIAFHAGAVVVGTGAHHAAEALALVRELGLDLRPIFNRDALMLLPGGVDKGTGVRRALEELGRSEHNRVAFGDAENDHPMLALAELAVAPRGAVPAVGAIADEQLSHPGAGGVAQFIARLGGARWTAPTPARQHIVIGREPGGAALTLPSSGRNVMISGDPRAGKSWVAGMIAEQLVERGYRLCIIDPEGDHLALGQRSRILVLGHGIPLPEANLVPKVLLEQPLSVVVNLAALQQPEKLAYVDRLLRGLDATRAHTGIPQWTLVDEAHYFFHEAAARGLRFDTGTGNFIFVTYRPSLVAPHVFAAVEAHVIVHTEVDEERYFITSLLRDRGPRDLLATDALAAIEPPLAGLLLEDGAAARWQTFTPGPRLTTHIHHGRKYMDASLPDDKAFRFLFADGMPVVAHNVREFVAAVRSLPFASLKHHLLAGDFSRWARDVLGDADLAGGLRKLEATARAGAAPSRAEIVDHVQSRYVI